MAVQQTVDQTNDPGLVHATVVGFNARNNAAGLISVGPTSPNNDSAIALAVLGGQFVENGDFGIKISHARMATVRGAICRNNGNGGIKLNDTTNISISGCDLRNNGKWGVYVDGVTDNVTAVGNIAEGNPTKDIYDLGGQSKLAGNISETVASVTAASTITLPELSDLVVVSGATSVTSITPSRNGRRVTLGCASSSVSIVSGVNLKLQGDFSANLFDTLTLICEDGVWFELSRSAN